MIPFMTAACSSKQTTSLTFIETTDTHGAFHEMANDAYLIRQMKNTLGDKLILLDNGDNLQGSPYQYCSNHDADHPNVAASVLNYFPYDVVGVGNHDIEAGRPVFDRLFSEVKMPVVCANVLDDKTGEPYWQPYVVLNRDGSPGPICLISTLICGTPVPQ